jgi:RimJ/RimL family protein N-acetyltransferase
MTVAGVPVLQTPRLVLRAWQPADRAPFAALNADPVVMEHFPGVLSRADSDAALERFEAGWRERGYGLWAAERRDTGVLVGFVGLSEATFPAPFTPAVEVGWRLARAHWGQGLATEGARAALGHGFAVLGLQEIVSFTAQGNWRSRRVMERLRMSFDGTFDHPALPVGHPLCRHVLYRINAAAWYAAARPVPDTRPENLA